MPSQRRTNQEARSILAGAQERENRASGARANVKTSRAAWRPSWRDAAMGAILGVLSGIGLARLGLIGLVPILRGDHLYGIAALVGLVLGISRLRPLLWVGAGVAVVGSLVVGYTPLAQSLIQDCVRRDPLHRAEAVVVLSSDIFPDGEMTSASQVRFLRGYEVVRQGYAPRLVLTRLRAPKRSYVPALRAQLARLNVSFPIEETEPVGNTRDEAVAVSRMARQRGWKTVILVSDASHLRRAGAAFEKTGLRVLCTPSADRDYDLENLSTPGQRVDAFRDWLWETVGYHTYRRNGWI